MIELEMEVPTEVPDIPNWSENYCFDAFDAEQNAGFWIHIGRWGLNPHLWREQVLAYLPDGSFLLRRGYGARPSTLGPRGAILDLRCEKPGELWRLMYGRTGQANDV